MAIGSHMWRPSCADLAAAPNNNNKAIKVITLVLMYGANENIVA
jgi:hypothetical protein